MINLDQPMINLDQPMINRWPTDDQPWPTDDQPMINCYDQLVSNRNMKEGSRKSLNQ